MLYKQNGEGSKLLEPTLWFRSLSPILRRSKHLKTGVQETALKKEVLGSISLNKSLENIDRGPGLEAAQIPSCGGRE